MVQASTLLVAAAFVVAPVLAAPAPHVHRHIAADSVPAVSARSIDNLDLLDLEAREPNPFNFKKLFSGAVRVVKKVAPIALKAGSMLLRRDEDGNVYVRELDADELAFLEARDPKFNLGRTFRQVTGAVSKGLGVADRVMGAARTLGLRELEDGDYLEEREFDPSSLYFDLEERDFEDFDELDARDPFSFGRFVNRFKGAAGTALNVAGRVSNAAHSLGLRELDADEIMALEARSFDELD